MSEFIVTEAEDTRLDRWLAERVGGRARNQIQHDIEQGRVLVGGQARPARYRVCLGDRIEYALPAAVDARLRPEAIPLTIVYEDEHLLVIDKPAGMVVHPAPGHASGTVANALLAHCGPALEGVGGEGGEERWGIVHRLDNLTSGLMMAAKTQPAFDALVAALGERRIKRQYLGLVVGMFNADNGSVDRPIGRRASDRKLMGITPDGKEARTDWRLICQDEGISLLGLSLHTGRTHQIRVHLQSIGHPILGDVEYGWSKQRILHALAQRIRPAVARVWPERQMLHATLLTLEHPVKKDRTIRLVSPPPEAMTQLMRALWGDTFQPSLANWIEQS